MIKVISWNIAKRIKPWQRLAAMDADVALLQEAAPPPEEVAGQGQIEIGPRESWDSHTWNSDWWHGHWPTLYDRWAMVVRLSDRVKVEWFKQVGPVGWPKDDQIAVSGIGTIAAARVTPLDNSIEPFFAASMYGRGLGLHPTTQRTRAYYDASVHRIISDLSAFMSGASSRVLAAGDLNAFYDYEDYKGKSWAPRDQSVFNRMEALGFSFVGPRPPAGNQTTRCIDELPSYGKVPTYYHNHQTPATASYQIDYAFASKGFADRVSVRALNSPEEWGPSDHCRLEITIS